MEWDKIVEKVTPYLVKIESPRGHGTGFLCFRTETGLCCIATANHVVALADKWQEPLRITQFAPQPATQFVKESERVIFCNPDSDSAIILTSAGDLKLPEQSIPLMPSDHLLAIGSEVGWLGFPAIGPGSNTLCFFTGSISAWLQDRKAYLIDGVAINGSSGGPVFFATAADGVHVVGTISAYIANRATGEALPGLSVAQDVSHFHATHKHIKSIEDARKKQAEQAQQAQTEKSESAQDGPTEPPAAVA